MSSSATKAEVIERAMERSAEESRAGNRDRTFDGPSLAILIGVHAAALACFAVPLTAGALALFVTFTLLTGFGITIGFHRFLSHRSFKCSRGLTYVWATLGSAALQGGPLFWVGLHRRHHQFGDREGDPHSPRESMLEGHMLWIARRETKAGAVLYALRSRDLREMNRDPYLKWLDRGLWVMAPWLVTLGICFLVAGWPGLVWGGIARTLFVWHAIWLVNSVGHTYGARPHDTRDNSRNVWWLAPIALGDQWHNNHHANPRAAILSERWWQLDPSGWVIAALEKLGLASDVVRPGD